MQPLTEKMRQDCIKSFQKLKIFNQIRSFSRKFIENCVFQAKKVYIRVGGNKELFFGQRKCAPQKAGIQINVSRERNLVFVYFFSKAGLSNISLAGILRQPSISRTSNP